MSRLGLLNRGRRYRSGLLLRSGRVVPFLLRLSSSDCLLGVKSTRTWGRRGNTSSPARPTLRTLTVSSRGRLEQFTAAVRGALPGRLSRLSVRIHRKCPAGLNRVLRTELSI